MKKLKNLHWTSTFNSYVSNKLPVDFEDFYPFTAFTYSFSALIGSIRLVFNIEGNLECNLPLDSEDIYYDTIVIKCNFMGIDIYKDYKISKVNQRINIIHILLMFLNDLQEFKLDIEKVYNKLDSKGFLIL